MGSHAVRRSAGLSGDHADQVRTLFDAKAAGWPAKYAVSGRLTGRLPRLADAISRLVPPGGELLDLGCGSGELARHLAAGGYQVTGCDIAAAMLRRAVAADQEHRVRWIQLEPRWQVLPFADRSMDAVVSASVLEYLRDPVAALAECARVLRPGGVLVCTVPNMAHPVRWGEWPLHAVMRSPLAAASAAAAASSRRTSQYLAYLRVSCQRRRVGWWHAAARQAGFEPVTAVRGSRRLPLSLLIFAQAGDTAGRTLLLEEQ